MSRNDSYFGGSTIVRWGSSWFARPKPDVDPETGETREERINRLAAEAKRRKEQKEKKSKKQKRRSSLNALNKQLLRNERVRLKKVARNRARLAEQDASVSPGPPRLSDIQQQERMSKVVVEEKPKRKVKAVKK